MLNKSYRNQKEFEADFKRIEAYYEGTDEIKIPFSRVLAIAILGVLMIAFVLVGVFAG